MRIKQITQSQTKCKKVNFITHCSIRCTLTPPISILLSKSLIQEIWGVTYLKASCCRTFGLISVPGDGFGQHDSERPVIRGQSLLIFPLVTISSTDWTERNGAALLWLPFRRDFLYDWSENVLLLHV